jgi:hypothetical protein
MDALNSERVRKLSEQMKSGFEDYATTHGGRMRIGSVTDSPEKNTALIRSYGMEFVRILKGQTDWVEDLPQLREDLLTLTEKGCPQPDIIQLTLACTRGHSFAVSDTLKSIGLADPSLQLLSELCELVSGKIAALNAPGVHGPLFFFRELLPELPDDKDRAELIADLHRLPKLLSFFGNLLSMYPPKKELQAQLEPILKDYELFLLYNLLNHYGFGFPTLSRLLMAMRRVCFRIAPKPRYVRGFRPAGVKRRKASEAGETALRDPFSVTALQRRLHRFSKESRNWEHLVTWSMLRYLSGEWSKQRASGETLLDLMPKILRKPMDTTIPVLVSPTPRPGKPVR